MENNDAHVRLVFAGEVLEGFRPDEVKRRFGEAFKLDEARLAPMFSGARTVLKRSMARSDAERYVSQLKKLGARIHVEPLEQPATGLKPTAVVAPTVASLSPLPELKPIEEEIVCPNCGERQSKRVFCRSCTTDMPRGIAAKKEDADRARAERQARQRGERYAPPNAEVGVVTFTDTDEPPPLLSFDFSGRLGRASYLNAGFLAFGMVALIGIGAAVILPMTRSWLLFIPLAIAFLLFVIWGTRCTVLRLHDLNLSGWLVLVTYIPYLGALANLVLVVVPGSPGDNDYGAKPRRGNLILAVVLLVVIVILAIVGSSSYSKYVERARARHTSGEQTQADPAAAQQAAQYLHSPAARDSFAEYAAQSTHKAFAASGSGAWGWRAGQASQSEAARSAMAACEATRKPYTSECELMNVDGAWALHP